MESITNSSLGNFCSWGSGLVSSCTNNCCDKQHYHRHCGCALHSVSNGLKVSPLCTPSRTVKVSRPAARSGMYRSLSVQNLSEKKLSSACTSSQNSYSGDESASSFNFSPNRSDLDFSSVGKDDLPSLETLMLVEELASFINLVKDEDTCSSFDGQDAIAKVDMAHEVPPCTAPTSLGKVSTSHSTNLIAGSTGQQVTCLPSRTLPMVMELSSIFLTGDHYDVSLSVAVFENSLYGSEPKELNVMSYGGHRRMKSYGG